MKKTAGLYANTTPEIVTFLRDFNRWRRGDDSIPQPQPDMAGKMIDAACNRMERLEGALQGIASLDTSQDASPQQCAAVLLAMNVLGK
jgi:hypothetical protein